MNHPYHGIPNDLTMHNGAKAGSKFEFRVLTMLVEMLPVDVKPAFQHMPQVASDFHPRLDAVVESDGCKFCLEIDGSQHYEDAIPAAWTTDFVSQTIRDRRVDRWALANGFSMFHVPFTFYKKPREALEYVINAARRDFRNGVARVHFLDFANTYAKINDAAWLDNGVESLRVEKEDGFPGVCIWSQ